MHQRLATVASSLWGVDIDSEGIAFLRSEGFENLAIGDICELDKIEALKERRFEAIVASEVVEHLLNPGLFLESVKSAMIPGTTELIITVPNAFRVETLLSLLRDVEYVHPDHNYWFSYHTANNLLRKTGFAVREVCVYSFQPTSLLPSPFRRRANGADVSVTGGVGRDERPAHSDRPRSRALAYLRSLPRRLIVSFLRGRSAFWGDGLIIVATLPEPD